MSNHLNSFVQKQRKVRKRDIRKLTDIRVPVCWEAYLRLQDEGRRVHLSMTKFATKLVEELLHAKEIQTDCSRGYRHEDCLVHVKIDEETYGKLCDYMERERISTVREAAYRLLHIAMADKKLFTGKRELKINTYSG